MNVFLLCLGAVTLALALTAAILLIGGNRTIGRLSDVAPALRAAVKVSIIVAARNEEEKVEAALLSLLSQDYPDFEIVVVNDRSTDRTAAILDRLGRDHPGLHVIHLRELPPGWLGKNYALYAGSEQAQGELLLFTDADVVMEPTTLSRAVAQLQDRELDHLTLAPQAIMPNALLDLFVGAFMVFFSIYARPWKARDPKSRAHIGIGAFNLVRREAYRAAGTHRAIRMRPDDDLKLGKLIKQAGGRQDILNGRGMIRVRWYASFAELIDGLMKNTFAGLEYSVAAVVLTSAAQLLFNVWPFAAVFVTSGPTRLLNLAVVALIVAICFEAARFSGNRRWLGILFPLATLLFVYIVWRSMVVTLASGGITWRGTHYKLAELRANRI